MAVDFDLFGDPIPEGWGKRGRPPHVPTDEKRNRVMLLLAHNKSDAEIAASLAISEPTLRKHYFRELKVRAEARLRADAVMIDMLWDEMRKGNIAAMKEWTRILERNDAKAAAQEFGAKKPAQPKRGKKELRDEAARSVKGIYAPPPPPSRVN
jgi:hypothetical protein